MFVSKTMISLGLAVALATSALTTSMAASAAPFSGAVVEHSADAGLASKVWYRGGRGWGWGGPAILGGLIIGGVLTAAAINEHRASESAMHRCADTYRSFDWRSGTYIDRSGERRVCPFLY